jgi:drug/metabolite transporter (DMT)-like permease
VIAFYRLWFAIPLLWILAAAIPSIRRRLGRDWLVGCVVGGSLFGLHQILFFTAVKLTSVANVTIIGALQPILVLFVAGPLFGEPVPRRALGWAGLALLGTALVVLGATGASGASPRGDALAFVNLFAFTAYFLASKRIRARVGSWEYVIGMSTVSGVLVTVVVLAMHADLTSPQAFDFAILFTLALFPGTLGHVLTNWAHAHATAFSISMMLLAVPVVSTTGAAVALGETLTRLQLLGGIVVLASIAAVVASVAETSGEAKADELAASAAETDAP